jgi:hypothetical protein
MRALAILALIDDQREIAGLKLFKGSALEI